MLFIKDPQECGIMLVYPDSYREPENPNIRKFEVRAMPQYRVPSVLYRVLLLRAHKVPSRNRTLNFVSVLQYNQKLHVPEGACALTGNTLTCTSNIEYIGLKHHL